MNRPALVAGLVAAWTAPAFAIDPPSHPIRQDLYGHSLPDGAVARLGDSLLRTVKTREFTFSRDGRYVARHRDTGIDVRDLTTGRDVTPSYLVGLRGSTLHFAPDGRHVVVETARGLCRVYDPASGAVVIDMSVDGRHPWHAAVSGNGRSAFVRWYDGRGGAAITLFDLTQSGRPVGRDVLAGQQGAACLSTDGAVLYAATDSGARAFETATGNELPRPPLRHLSHVHGVALSADGKTLAAAHADNLRFYPVSANGVGEPTVLPPVDLRNGMAWAKDGRELVVASRDAVVRLDGKSGQVLGQSLPEGGTFRGPTALSPDGRFAADVGGSEPAMIWDTRSGEIRFRYPDRAPLVRVVCLDERTAVTLGSGLQLEVWSLTDGRPLAARSLEVPHRLGWPTAQFSSDGRQIAVFDSSTRAMHVCDVSTGRLQRAAGGWVSSFPTGIGFASDNRRLVIASEGRVGLGDTVKGQSLRELPGTGLAAGFSPDGRLVAVLDRNQVRLVEVLTNRVRRAMAVPDVPLDGKDVRFTAGRIRFSGDGSRLVVFGSCYRVWVWSVADGELLYEDRGDRTNLYSDVWPGDLSRDGRWLAYPSDDGMGVRIIDLANPRPGGVTTAAHKARVSDVSFAPDGAYLVSAGSDGIGLVWDVGVLVGKSRPKPADHTSTVSLWEALADTDAAKAGQAIEELARKPTPTVTLLDGRLTPAVAPDPAVVRRLVDSLDNGSFEERDRAERELRGYREQVTPELNAALKQPRSAEHRDRLERLLGQADGVEYAADRVRLLRAIEVLERIGGTQARGTLERLAGGAPHARLTRESRAALDRMNAARPVLPR
jgi:WD40 repeat protein